LIKHVIEVTIQHLRATSGARLDIRQQWSGVLMALAAVVLIAL